MSLPAYLSAAPTVDAVRRQLGAAIFARVAGVEGPANRDRIHLSEGPRWFDEETPIRRVHGDASMFVGGLRALLLQSLHPLAMAGVAGHSGYQGDPWGRLQRTSTFLATTTFGTAADAERAVARVRGVHQRVRGTAADGRAYFAMDPHLLRWVHVAEVDSFLRAHQMYGAERLDQQGRDRYVAETGRVATALGVVDPPLDEGQLAAELAGYRPELRSTPEARAAARFMLLHPPVPLAARFGYAVLSAAAVGLLPRWARMPLRLPYLPLTEATVIRGAGHGLTAAIRWVMSPPPATDPVPVLR